MLYHLRPEVCSRNCDKLVYLDTQIGLAARLGSHWEVEIGTKVQRVSGFEYVDRTSGFLLFLRGYACHRVCEDVRGVAAFARISASVWFVRLTL